jgi:hypothetical protein
MMTLWIPIRSSPESASIISVDDGSVLEYELAISWGVAWHPP